MLSSAVMIQVTPAVAIGDDGLQDAGILAEDAQGFTVDTSFAVHYRTLCRKYLGARDMAVPPGAGLLVLPGGGCWIDKKHMLDFLVMRAKERANLKGDR